MPMAVPAAICHPAESIKPILPLLLFEYVNNLILFVKTGQANHDPGSFQHYQAPFHSSAPVSGLPILSDSVIQALGSLADSREEDTFMRIADSIVGTNSNGNAALTLLNPQVDDMTLLYTSTNFELYTKNNLYFTEPAATNEANILILVSKHSVTVATTV